MECAAQTEEKTSKLCIRGSLSVFQKTFLFHYHLLCFCCRCLSLKWKSWFQRLSSCSNLRNLKLESKMHVYLKVKTKKLCCLLNILSFFFHSFCFLATARRLALGKFYILICCFQIMYLYYCTVIITLDIMSWKINQNKM